MWCLKEERLQAALGSAAGTGRSRARRSGLWARMSQEITPSQSSFRKSLQSQKMPPFAGFSPKSVFVGWTWGDGTGPPHRVLCPESSAQTNRLGAGNTCDAGRCDTPQAPQQRLTVSRVHVLRR